MKGLNTTKMEQKMSTKLEAVELTQNVINKLKDVENPGMILPTTFAIFSSIHEEGGEGYLIQIKDNLYGFVVQSLLGHYREEMKGDSVWAEEIGQLKSFIENGDIEGINDPSVQFFFRKIYEIMVLTYVEDRITDALFLMLAMRTFILFLLENER